MDWYIQTHPHLFSHVSKVMCLDKGFSYLPFINLSIYLSIWVFIFLSIKVHARRIMFSFPCYFIKRVTVLNHQTNEILGLNNYILSVCFHLFCMFLTFFLYHIPIFQPAINMLLSIIKRGDKDSTSTTKRRKKDESALLRPIICICNDLYVPALRQLRQQALVITIPQIASPTLASRLLEVGLAH